MKYTIPRTLLGALIGFVWLAEGTGVATAQTVEAAIKVEVDLKQTGGPLDHIWSKCAGSDRAIISLREDWRNDLTRVHEEAGIERVRFHGIFADELGVYTPSLMSRSKDPNWQNVDRVYDGLLKRGVRPYVELSFMPKRLTSGTATFGFYRALITPPTDMAEWGAFIKLFAQHLVDRYGIDEVRQWMFEVWNEPNLPFFWTGTQAEYFELYKTSVTAIKSIDAKFRVGGPSTSAVQWIPEFLAYCEGNALPLDFISTHIYIGDKQQKIFGKPDAHPPSEVVPAGMAQVRAQIDASKYKGIPLWLTEWSSDSPAMIAHVIKNCLGLVQAMSQWAFTNTYEELGVAPFILKEGDNGYGMIAAGSIPKPQFNSYKLLHRLGNRRLVASEGPVLASRRDNGSVAIAVWNLAEVLQPGGIPGASFERKVTGEQKQILLTLKGARAGQSVQVSYVDQTRGSPFPEWRKLGSPQYPTMAQMDTIRKSAELAAPTAMKLGKNGELLLDLPAECLALVEVDG